MSSNFSFPENCKIVQAVAPAVGAGLVITSDYISLKDAHKCWIVIHYYEAHNGAAVVYQPMKATAVLPSDATAITTAVKIWSNVTADTTDLLVERTAAVLYTGGAVTLKAHIIIFEIDPVDLGATYDCIGFTASTPAAGDYISALFVIQPRYQTRVLTAPTSLTD
jgi:hypothetical protein